MIERSDSKVQSKDVTQKHDSNKHDSNLGSGSKLKATWQTQNANFNVKSSQDTQGRFY